MIKLYEHDLKFELGSFFDNSSLASFLAIYILLSETRFLPKSFYQIFITRPEKKQQLRAPKLGVLTPRFSRWQIFATCVNIYCNFRINFVF